MTDRLHQLARETQIAREAQAPKVRSAFDEAVLAAGRDQAKINAQQFAARESASKHLAVAQSKADVPWWKTWPVWAGSGSFAAVIATVLLITGQPTNETLPEQAKQSTANAPAIAPVIARADVPAAVPAQMDTSVPAEAPKVRAVAQPDLKPTAALQEKPKAARPDAPAPSIAKDAASSAELSANGPLSSTSTSTSPSAAAPLVLPPPPAVAAPRAVAPSAAVAPLSTPAPAMTAAQTNGVSENSGLAQSKRAEVRALPKFSAPQTIDQCANDVRAIAQDRRNATDPVWLRLASYCKSTFPNAQWPADLGAINSTNIESVKE